MEDKLRKTKLMFILSSDFGELATAMYFIGGYAFQTVFLMPDRLFDLHKDCVPGPVYHYRTMEQVTAAVEKENPDIVFLFSGYLFAVNNIFNMQTVKTFVQEMVAANRLVITSDPFLGIMSVIDDTTFNKRHPLRLQFAEHFSMVSRIFENVMHLYLIDAHDFAKTPHASFFNPHILLDRGHRSEQMLPAEAAVGMDPQKPRWLFILSTEDYSWQITRHGKEEFGEMLIRMLHRTVAANRQPVLIAHQEAFEDLQIARQSADDLVFKPHCRYDHFMSLLFDAEYVFYWNIFSNSIPARVLNHLPVFFFEPGHMAHAIPALYETGIKHYYQGAKLDYLDQGRMPSADELVQLASRQGSVLYGAINRFMQSPTPDQLVAKLLLSQ
jgi:hypothetical protein